MGTNVLLKSIVGFKSEKRKQNCIHKYLSTNNFQNRNKVKGTKTFLILVLSKIKRKQLKLRNIFEVYSFEDSATWKKTENGGVALYISYEKRCRSTAS
ncbi:CLUMA_CG012272, isoform A [Clunio marinus]|uniref:CLUMA_CG012272, isoform A n=1 Tax=Clunio marinus TaxID=568069 RepID=A0A1J1IGM8_9DIPT|nr:CLUMA_CG012272, isoform A [Clunio marinus]